MCPRASVDPCSSPPSHCSSASPSWAGRPEGPVLGRATIANVAGGQCQMWIAPLEGRGIYFRCVLFAHEYGHWIGFPDDPPIPPTRSAPNCSANTRGTNPAGGW